MFAPFDIRYWIDGRSHLKHALWSDVLWSLFVSSNRLPLKWEILFNFCLSRSITLVFCWFSYSKSFSGKISRSLYNWQKLTRNGQFVNNSKNEKYSSIENENGFVCHFFFNKKYRIISPIKQHFYLFIFFIFLMMKLILILYKLYILNLYFMIIIYIWTTSLENLLIRFFNRKKL